MVPSPGGSTFNPFVTPPLEPGEGPEPGSTPATPSAPGPSTAPPPTRPGAPSVRPGAGSTPAAPPAVRPPDRRPAGGTTGGVNASTGRKKAAAGLEATPTWSWWWAFNGETFAATRFIEVAATTAADDIVAEVADARASRRDAARLTGRAAAELARRFVGDRNAEIRARALLALGRSGDRSFTNALRRGTTDEHPDVRAAAALALGLLGGEAACEELQRLLDPAAPQADGARRSTDPKTRAHACLALGIAAGASIEAGIDAAAPLARLGDLAQGRDATSGFAALATLGLGLSGEASLAPLLLRLASSDPGTDRSAAALWSLGRVGGRSALPVLVGATGSAFAGDRRAAVLALERAATHADAFVVEALAARATDDRDAATRRYALLALGALGGARAEAVLVGALDRGGDDAAHAALAIGRGVRNDVLPRRAAERLVTGLGRESNCTHRGAYAMALGLARHPNAREALVTIVRGDDHAHLRAEAAEALGYLGDPAGERDLLEALIQDRTPELRAAAARALVLLGRPASLERLNGILAAADGSLILGGSLARAFGGAGDRRTLAVLESMLTSESTPAPQRIWAATALGLLTDSGPVSRAAVLLAGIDYVSLAGPVASVVRTLRP